MRLRDDGDLLELALVESEVMDVPRRLKSEEEEKDEEMEIDEDLEEEDEEDEEDDFDE